MNTIRLLISGLLVFGVAYPLSAFVPYVNSKGQVLRWNLVSPGNPVHPNVVNRTTKAIRYFVASDLYSNANKTAEMNAVRACFAQWQSIPGSILKFEEAGLLGPGADINTADNTNVVFWAKASTLVNGGFDDIRGLRGLTILALTEDNLLLEGDIVLNGVEYSWFTDFNDQANPNVFIESVLLHEIGHFIGLDHTPVGGATVVNSGNGVSTEAGLSADEIAAVHSLYPQSTIASQKGYLRGRITANGNNVFGAMVVAEDLFGNLAAGTVSRQNGIYELPALTPGNYNIRVSPLDRSDMQDRTSLMRGYDIAADYENAFTSFLPTTNKPVTLQAGTTNTLDVAVQAGEPPFRITAIREPSRDSQVDVATRWAHAIAAGTSNIFVGVVSHTLPTFEGSLGVTGDGINVGETIFKPFRFADGRNLMLISIDIASNATPGLRSFVVKLGSNIAYANGYLEILPPEPDFNFDGLDDRFQRRYFPLFTASESGPDADPDGDGFNNRFEANNGSNPTDAQSINFRIDSVKMTSAGTVVSWQSAPGKRFQLFSRPDVPGSNWQPVGAPVTARGSTTQMTDVNASGPMKFYRVQLVP